MFLCVKYFFPFYFDWPNMPILMGFLADFLVQKRGRKDLTQEQIAISLGIQTINVSRWETGKEKIPPKHWRQLAGLLSVPIDELVEVADKENPKAVFAWRKHFDTDGLVNKIKDSGLRPEVMKLAESVSHLDDAALAIVQQLVERLGKQVTGPALRAVPDSKVDDGDADKKGRSRKSSG